jgi:ABC-2 type transport system ATP-binding protein
MIVFEKVAKRYGKTTALDNLYLTVSEPGIHCLLGRNGAGTTTLMKLAAGHIGATDGAVSVYGVPVSTFAMPESVHFIESGAAQFNVKLEALFGYAARVNPDMDMDFALRMAGKFNLDVRKRYKQLSLGMKVMASTLIALSSGKGIILLDEPVLGFDPIMRKTFYDLLQSSCEEKEKIVIVSTHIIDEIEKVAQQLIILDGGKIKLSCPMYEIDEKAYSVTGTAENVKAATEGLRIIGESSMGGFLSRHIFDRRIEASDKYAVASLGLQDFFVGLVGDEAFEKEAM